MRRIYSNYVLIIFFLITLLMVIVPILADEKAENQLIDEDMSVPLEGITIYKNSPYGYLLNQPDGIMLTVSAFSGHNLLLFLKEDKPFLSVDVVQSNSTLDENIAIQKTLIEKKKDSKFISEGETTLAGQPAFFVNFTYIDELGKEKSTHEIIAINRGFNYILMFDENDTVLNKKILSEMINSFEYIPVGEDSISKMVKTKMKRMSEPSKAYRYHSYSLSNSYDYSWDYYYDWCNCNTSYIDYYCECY